MTLVDEHGRLFGRWNVIDGLIAIMLLGLLPLLYGGYLLFRPAAASLTSIEPARILSGTATEFTIHGTNLRPYMRVSFNSEQGADYLFRDATKAVVPARPLPPGVYDVILFDNAQERARIPKGLEVIALPRPEVQLDLVGAFTAIAEGAAAQLKPGLRIDNVGEIVRLGKAVPAVARTTLGNAVLDLSSTGPFNIPAVVRATCVLVPRGGGINCMLGDQGIAEDVALTVNLPGGGAIFQVNQIRTLDEVQTITAHVRFSGERAVLDQIREGDRDVRRDNEFLASGTIVSLSVARPASLSVGVAVPAAPGIQPFIATELAFRDAVLRLPAQRVSGRWHYAGRSLTAGSVVTFSGPAYEVRATILSVEAAGPANK